MKRILENFIPFLFVMLSAFLIAVVFLVLSNIKTLDETKNLVEETYTIINLNEDVLIDVISIESSIRGFLLVDSDSFLKPYENSIKNIESKLLLLKMVTEDRDTDGKADELQRLIILRIADTKNSIINHKQNNLTIEQKIKITLEGKKLSDKIKNVIQEINSRQLALLAQRKHDNIDSDTNLKLIVGVLILVILFLILVGFAILKIQQQKNKLTDELKKSNNLFSTLFEHNPACISLVRISDHKIIKVNNSFVDLLGYSSADEIIGKSENDLNLIVETSDVEAIAKLIQENQIVKNYEMQVRTKNGTLIWTSASIIMMEVENIPCVVSVSMDINAIKKSEEKLLAVNRELEAFSYSVSHDLRAPLRAIGGYATILIEDYKDVIDADGNGFLKSMLQSSKTMGNLIDDLLAFSRLGRSEMVVSEIDMNSLVKTVVFEQLKNDAEKIDIQILNLPSAIGQPTLIKQVWVNLISNAVKYSQHKPNQKIEISSFQKNGQTVYFIKDNGVGFDMQYYNKLFGVFQRLHSKEEFEGTGIGLAIVQKVISRHNGTVWAESKINEGSTFYFSLPKIKIKTK